MGYDFDVNKMPADMQSLYYQTASKSGDKTKIDSELEYSLFWTRTKKMLDSGTASFSNDDFNAIFGFQKSSIVSKEDSTLSQIAKNGVEQQINSTNPISFNFPKFHLNDTKKIQSLSENEIKNLVKILVPGAEDILIENIEGQLYRYTVTFGNIKSYNYVQRVGSFTVNEDGTVKIQKEQYIFYDNGNIEHSGTLEGHKSTYDKNGDYVYEELSNKDGKITEACNYTYNEMGNLTRSYFIDYTTGYKEVSDFYGEDNNGNIQVKTSGLYPVNAEADATYNDGTPRALQIRTKIVSE